MLEISIIHQLITRETMKPSNPSEEDRNGKEHKQDSNDNSNPYIDDELMESTNQEMNQASRLADGLNNSEKKPNLESRKDDSDSGLHASNEDEFYEDEWGTYTNAIFNTIFWKNNWEQKVFDPKIVAKWEKETKKQNIDMKDFTRAINILREMSKHEKKLKVTKDHHYSDSESENDIIKEYKTVLENNNCPYIVTSFDNLIDDNLCNEFKDYISQHLDNVNNMKTREYHPGSQNMMIDLIHPSLYCFVRGVSTVNQSLIDDDIKQCNENGLNGDNLMHLGTDDAKSFLKQIRQTRDDTQYYHEYGWLDQPPINKENVMYQWMPSQFRLIPSAKDPNQIESVKIESYINNLHPIKHEAMYRMIEKIFLKFVQSFDLLKRLNSKAISNELQVIVKLQKIELTPNNSEYKGGAWHLEGMDFEHIVATGIYYYEMENIGSSYLEFREKLEDPTDNPQDDAVWVWENHHLLRGQISNDYKGKIKIKQGKCIMFENEYQHHVTKFKLKNDQANGTRSILVFFIIDPKYKIISTKHVPIQQPNIMLDILRYGIKARKDKLANDIIDDILQIIVQYLPCFSLKQAREYREKLMFARKFYIDEINNTFYEREVTYCEH